MQFRLKHILVLALAMATTSTAFAGSYDISLRGLGRPDPGNLKDAAYLRFQKLGNELGMSLAPRPLAPAETLGVSGFEFAFATVHADISQDESYWRGQPGSPVLEGVADGNGVPSGLWIPTLHIRKGLPMSTELGITASYLAFSEMFLLGVETKIGIHESYYRWVPSIAFRGAVGTLFGSTDIKLTTVETDILTSLPIGLDGIVQLTPYLGYGMLFVDVISGIIDETPYNVSAEDQNGRQDGSLYVFERLNWYDNRSHRIIMGLRANYAFFELIYEVDIGIVPVADKTLQSHSIKIGFDT